ncbi:NADH-quinone oxidoreductase subunit C [Streptomyces sp. NPDC060035]|uniref:NADH-quinone oxidoreductase subunit C n=1 Tax=Streptomyces sp. NPDC060035 TaxID=3347044 RepID=UPI0036A3F611
MTAADTYDRLPDAVADIFGEDATAAYAYDLLTVDVPASSWIAALETARDELGCGYFDWLSAVDEPGTGFLVCAHVAAPRTGRVRRLLVRTTVPHEAPALPSAIGVYAGAAWHERETHEMFGIRFEDHPHLVPLLLPEGFEGHPLRKDFILAARVAKAWPGAKEPGESEHGGPKRRTMLPPGVPDPNEWGPLKGQLPPAPVRPARAARAAGDRPVRRDRSASEGSAAQRPATPDATAPDATMPDAAAPDVTATPQAAPQRRSRSVSQGSASQPAEATAPATGPTPPTGPPPAATGPEAAPPTGAPEPTGSDSGRQTAPSDAAQPAAPPATEGDAAGAPAEAGEAGTEPKSTRAPRAVRSTDAPWHHARPAFDDAPDSGATDSPEPTASAPGAGPAPENAPDQATEPEPEPEPEPGPAPEPGLAPAPGTAPAPGPAREAGTRPAPEAAARPAPAPQSGAAPAPGSGPRPEPGAAEPESDPDAEPDADPDAEPDADPDAEPEPDPRTDRPAGGDTA